MNKQELLKTIDRVVGTDGSLRIPSWWMHKILSDIVRYCEGKGNGDADELRDEIYKGLSEEDIEAIKAKGIMSTIEEGFLHDYDLIFGVQQETFQLNQKVTALENRQLVILSNELPSEPKDNTIYLVPSPNGEGNNVLTEWVFINGTWEKFGEFNAGADFNQFAKKSEIPTKTSQLTNDSGFITKSSAPDWNASTYKDGHIKNRTHHMQDYMCHYFKGSPIKVSKPRDVGYILLTYDTDLADKFIRIEINANESKTYEFADAMGMPLIFRWDAGASTINVESFMGAVDTYGMRAYYSSSAKGYDEYFVALDEGFIPQGVARKSDIPSIGEHEKVHVATSKEELGKLNVPIGSIGSVVSEEHTFEAKPSQVETGTIINGIKFTSEPILTELEAASNHRFYFTNDIEILIDAPTPFLLLCKFGDYLLAEYNTSSGTVSLNEDNIALLNKCFQENEIAYLYHSYTNYGGMMDIALTLVLIKPSNAVAYVKTSNGIDEPTPRKFSDFGKQPELFPKEERIVKNVVFSHIVANSAPFYINFKTIGGTNIIACFTLQNVRIYYSDTEEPIGETDFINLCNSTEVYYIGYFDVNGTGYNLDRLVSADFPPLPLSELKTWTPIAAPISSDDIDSLLAEVFGGSYYYSDDGIGSWDDYAYEVDGIGEFEEGETNVEELNIENNETGS